MNLEEAIYQATDRSVYYVLYETTQTASYMALLKAIDSNTEQKAYNACIYGIELFTELATYAVVDNALNKTTRQGI